MKRRIKWITKWIKWIKWIMKIYPDYGFTGKPPFSPMFQARKL